MKQWTVLFAAATLLFGFGSDDEKRVPTLDELIAIATPGSPRISPDGALVAYTRREADFEQDSYISQIWITERSSGENYQLTRGTSSAGNPRWSSDGKWLAFTSSRSGGKSQIFIISPRGGEAIRLTDFEPGVGSFRWSPDGRKIAFTASPAEPDSVRERKDKVGAFEVFRREYRYRHLWTIDVEPEARSFREPAQRTSGTQFSINSFSWSPDSRTIAFGATVNPDRIHFATSDVYSLDLANDSVRTLVDTPGPDWNPEWSPDGSTILFSTQTGRELFYAWNTELATIPANGGDIRVLTEAFDENPQFVAWKPAGIYFSALQKTNAHLFKLDPKSRRVERFSKPDDAISFSYSLNRAGDKAAFLGGSPTAMLEVHVADLSGFETRKLTDFNAQIQQFQLGQREVISWRSQDGTTIEGVLTKPPDFDPAKSYPLLCIIHGGPTGIDRPLLLGRGRTYYPEDIWVARGALVLRVNYRGSAGYGEAFRQLNKRNLGVGDAWDVLSGVEHLVKKGWVDPEKTGCMGWSQGGYISAFLTTSSDRFAAISVGAGISNWATYYYNTDITPFTINYLGDDPADDPEIYAKTSPMTHILKASTPTLIQHGEFDRRVPIPNAYELRQGLEDRGVPTELIVYKGFGHGINKPKSQRAVMWHNLVWFNHYLWGDPLPDLRAPEIADK